MIVDCHTQIWDSSARLGMLAPASSSQSMPADWPRHYEAVHPVDRAIVLGFKSRYLGAEIPNHYIADYVRKHSTKMVGFAGIDPTDADWLTELQIAQGDLGLKGVTISPTMQNFHPADSRALDLYEECTRRNMPILVEHNHRYPPAKLEFARPTLFDEVAREFPQLRIVIAHMGFPWIDETLVMLAKHPHIYADVAGLLRQPWLSYNALLKAHEYGVMNKLLFGSDFPHRSPAACIEALYHVNQVAAGTSLPIVPREQLRGVVERDTLGLLGLEAPLGTR